MRKLFTLFTLLLSLGAFAQTETLKPVAKAKCSSNGNARTLSEKRVSKAKRAASEGTTYLLFGKSMFNADGDNTFINGGTPVKYEVSIAWDADGASVDNLLRIPDYECDAVKGAYDDASKKLTLTAPASSTTYSDYITLFTDSLGCPAILRAGNAWGIGYFSYVDDVVFSVSDDKTVLIPQSGFGAEQIDVVDGEIDWEYGFHDLIYDAALFKKADGVAFYSDSTALSFEGNIFSGKSLTKSFKIYNAGSEGSDFVVTFEGEGFSSETKSGLLESEGYQQIDVTFSPTQAGEYTGRIIIESEAGETIVELRGVCSETPDYNKIVKEGSFQFTSSDDYPWTIDTTKEDVPVAISSNKGVAHSESVLEATFEVPKTQTNILSWSAYYDPYFSSYDKFRVYIDDEEVYSCSTPGDASSSVEVIGGTHTAKFVYAKGAIVDGRFEKGNDYTYIYNLALSFGKELSANKAEINKEAIDFGRFFVGTTEAEGEATITLTNQGYEDLTVTAIKADGKFSGIVPTESAKTNRTLDVTLKYTTSEVGDHTGNVVISTTAGDFTVKCSANAETMPDYQSIVKAGDFTFTTDNNYPFLVEDGVAYNSTAKIIDDDFITSYFSATFNVPEGTIGRLTWDGWNSSDDGTYGLGDGGYVDIDDSEIFINYVGECDASYYTLTPTEVYFQPGEHTVSFGYMQMGDGYYVGEDMIKISNLSLICEALPETEVITWGADSAQFKEIFATKSATAAITLANVGTKSLEVLSVDDDGPFSATFDTDAEYSVFETIPVTMTFKPEELGDFEGTVTIVTSSGNIEVRCKGTAKDMGDYVYIEDFEQTISGWTLIDNDGSGKTWRQTYSETDSYGSNSYGALYSVSNYYYDTCIDNWAITPEITIPDEGAVLTFEMASWDPYNPFQILVGKGDDVVDYEEVYSDAATTTDDYALSDYKLYTVDLSEYKGQTLSIAFRHYYENDWRYYLLLDNVAVKKNKVDAISTLSSNLAVKNREYFSIDGVKLNRPSKGVCIERTTNSDNSVTTRKIFVK